jgi:hypothetical protein
LQTLATDHDRQHRPTMTHCIVQDDANEAAERFLDRATEEARQLEHGWVGTEHLLLAIVSGADSELSAVLSDCAVTHGAVKATVQRILGEAEGEFFRTGDRAPSSGLYRFHTHTEPKRCFPSRPYQVDLAQGDRFPACGNCDGACRWQLVVPA